MIKHFYLCLGLLPTTINNIDFLRRKVQEYVQRREDKEVGVERLDSQTTHADSRKYLQFISI